jgi:multiple sugar transport system ATP-binding protein
MGTRIAVMNEGVLQQVGTPQTLYDEPINRFVAGFIGSPSMNFVEVTHDNETLAGPGDWSIPLPSRARAIAGDNGRKLVAGFRPEHLEVGEIGGESASFQARSDVVEYLGHEELLHVSAADQDVVAIVDSEHRIRPGDVIQLSIPLNKVHLFDAESGEALTTDRAAANVTAAQAAEQEAAPASA